MSCHKKLLYIIKCQFFVEHTNTRTNTQQQYISVQKIFTQQFSQSIYTYTILTFFKNKKSIDLFFTYLTFYLVKKLFYLPKGIFACCGFYF